MWVQEERKAKRWVTGILNDKIKRQLKAETHRLVKGSQNSHAHVVADDYMAEGRARLASVIHELSC